MIEIWWNKMFWPSKKCNHPPSGLFLGQCVGQRVRRDLACGGGVGRIGGECQRLVGDYHRFIVPFVFWNGMIGVVVYMHHTHERIKWYDDKAAWLASQPFVTTTVHLTFKYGFGGAVHHIMEHTAHHLDATIPLYKLKETQQRWKIYCPTALWFSRSRSLGTGAPRATPNCMTMKINAG